MTFSQRAALHFVPFLARLVLGAAFITAGMGKLFHTGSFEGDRAAKLRDLGVVATAFDGGAMFHAASFQQDSPPGTGSLRERGANNSNAGQDADNTDANQDAGGEGGTGTELQDPTVINVPPMTVEARELHNITLMVASASPGLEPYAVYLGWGAALTEFVGGILILVGLFSRLWGLALAVTMGVAFYLTSLGVVSETMIYQLMPDHVGDFNRLFVQLALFVLAFGIFLTGPGRLSVDGFIFGKRDDRTFTEDDEI